MCDLPALAGPQRALIVGINEYDSPRIRDLRGCVADARAMVGWLQQRCGLDGEQLRLLVSPAEAGEQRATREAITAGIRDFLAAAMPGEEVLFYYSGHGSSNPLEPDIAFGKRYGESLVPADARVGEVQDLLDRELRVLMAELLEQGLRLTVISDACHSGDVLRSADEQAGEQGPTARLTGSTVTPRGLSSLLDGTVLLERLERLYRQPLPYVLIAGALASQKSYEIPHQHNGSLLYRGAMTLALLEVLHGLQAPISYRELIRVVRARIPNHPARDDQYPDVVGEEGRCLFSPHTLERARPLFVVQEVAGDGTVTLDGGRVDGIDPGAELVAFADWRLTHVEGRWRVMQAEARRARVERTSGNSLPAPGQPMQLARLPSRPTVRFGPGTEEVATLWNRIYDSGGRTEVAPFLVQVSSEADYQVSIEGENWCVRRRDGSEMEQLRKPRDRNHAAQIAQQLDAMACYEQYERRVPAEGEKLPIPLSLAGEEGLLLQAFIVDRRRKRRPAAVGQRVAALQADERLVLTLKNLSERRLYINLFRLDPEYFLVQRLWPTDGTGELEPGDASEEIWWVPERGGNTLRVKLIASGQPLEGELFPCGERRAWRGSGRDVSIDFLEGLARPASGWATLQTMIGNISP